MSRSLVGILTLISLIVGIVLVCAPAGTHLWKLQWAEQGVEAYEENVLRLEDQDRSRQLNLARWYNLCLTGKIIQEDFQKSYARILDLGQGMMGYVEMGGKYSFPIYHTALPEAAGYGFSHLPGSAFPVGGLGNHTILSGPALIAQIEEGEVFSVHSMGKKISYVVERVRKVSPGNTAGLLPAEGEDRCTLITWTWHGSEHQKVLIHGIRTEDTAMQEAGKVPNDLLRLCAVCGSAVLMLPLLAGGVGKLGAWIAGKWNCSRSTKRESEIA